MHRTITAAAIVFAMAAFALHNTSLVAQFEEPLLLLVMGSLFLLVGKLLGSHTDKAQEADEVPAFAPHRQHVHP